MSTVATQKGQQLRGGVLPFTGGALAETKGPVCASLRKHYVCTRWPLSPFLILRWYIVNENRTGHWTQLYHKKSITFLIINSKYYFQNTYYVSGSMQDDDSERLNLLGLWSLESNWKDRHINITYKEGWWWESAFIVAPPYPRGVCCKTSSGFLKPWKLCFFPIDTLYSSHWHIQIASITNLALWSHY